MVLLNNNNLTKTIATEAERGTVIWDTLKYCGDVIHKNQEINGHFYNTKYRGQCGLIKTYEKNDIVTCAINCNDFIETYDNLAHEIDSTYDFVENAAYSGVFRWWKDSNEACWIPLRLLDVYEKCVIETSSRKSDFDEKYPAYVAFSRRWSSECINVGLEWPCNIGIAFSMNTLMEITKKMGFKWMWVDTLCIDQNNTTEKEKQIPYMGLVYSNAAVTIALLEHSTIGNKGSCMALNKDNKYGCKLDESIRSDRNWLNDKDLVLSINETIKKISNDVWFKRVWTLQELFKSSTLMYITRDGVVLANDTFKIIYGYHKQILWEINRRLNFNLEDATHFDFIWQWYEVLTPCSVASVLAWSENRETTKEHDKLFGILGMMNISHRPSYDSPFYENLNRFIRQVLKSGDVSVLFGIGCGILDECYSAINVNTFPSQFYKLTPFNSVKKDVRVVNGAVIINTFCTNCRLLTSITPNEIDDVIKGNNKDIAGEKLLSSLSGITDNVIIETAIDIYLHNPLRNCITHFQMIEASNAEDYIRHAKETQLTIALAEINDHDMSVAAFVNKGFTILTIPKNMTITYFDAINKRSDNRPKVPALLLIENKVRNGFNKIGVITCMPFIKTNNKEITLLQT